VSNETLRYVVIIVILLHGLGHVGGPWFFDRSWLSPGLAQGALRWVFIVLWLVAMVGFVGAAIGILLQGTWWRTLAVAAAAISLPVTLLFMGGTAAPNKLACVVVDVAILVALLWGQWPSAEVIGS
jgi:hypothetical protein